MKITVRRQFPRFSAVSNAVLARQGRTPAPTRVNQAARTPQPNLFDAVIEIHKVLPAMMQDIINRSRRSTDPKHEKKNQIRMRVLPFRAGCMSRPFSIFFPPPHEKIQYGARGAQRVIKKSAMISLMNLMVEPMEYEPGEAPVSCALDLHHGERPLPAHVRPSTLLRIASFLRARFHNSEIDVYFENVPGDRASDKPKGFVMHIDYKAAEPEPAEKVQRWPLIHNASPLLDEIFTQIHQRGLVPAGMMLEIMPVMGSEPFGMEIAAIGLVQEVSFKERGPYVSDTLIEDVLRIRGHLIEEVNLLRPGLRIPRLMAGDREHLPFDVALTGHLDGIPEDRRVREFAALHLGGLRVRADDQKNIIWDIPGGPERFAAPEFSNGVSCDEHGHLLALPGLKAGTLFKIAHVIREANGFGDADIVFTATITDKLVRSIQAHFVYSRSRDAWLQAGKEAAHLTRAEAEGVIANLQAKQVGRHPLIPPDYRFMIFPQRTPDSKPTDHVTGIGFSRPAS